MNRARVQARITDYRVLHELSTKQNQTSSFRESSSSQKGKSQLQNKLRSPLYRKFYKQEASSEKHPELYKADKSVRDLWNKQETIT